MLKLYTDLTTHEALSEGFKGLVSTKMTNSTTLLVADSVGELPSVGDKVLIDPQSRAILGTVKAVSGPSNGVITITLNSLGRYSEVVAGLTIIKYNMLNPDYVSGPGTNFGEQVRKFYLGIDIADPEKRYKNIEISVDGVIPTGVTVKLSKDGSTWVDVLQIGQLAYSGQQSIEIYRKVTVSLSESLDLSWLKYKITAEEYLDYGYNPEA